MTSFSFLSFGCVMDKYDEDLYVKNNSLDTIYSILSEDDIIGSSSYYEEFRRPENYLKTETDSVWTFVFSEIGPGEKIPNHDRYLRWSTYFKNGKDEKIRLFIVKKDSVSKYGWHKIFEKQIFNKKYTFTEKQFDSLNYLVEYY